MLDTADRYRDNPKLLKRFEVSLRKLAGDKGHHGAFRLLAVRALERLQAAGLEAQV